MTIIAVKDGIMAVDSMVTVGELKCGTTQKWMLVDDFFGGGFVAGCGDLSDVNNAMTQFLSGDKPDKLPDGSVLVWMDPAGKVKIYCGESWVEVDAHFYAEGSGMNVAIGAMAAGASAEEAAEIACEYVTTCGGEVHVLDAEAWGVK